MSIMDLFKTSGIVNGQQSGGQQQTGNMNSQQSASTGGTGNPGNLPEKSPPGAPTPDSNNPTAPAEKKVDGNDPKSLLDNYKELFTIDPNKKPDEPLSFNASPDQLMEAASKVDFTRFVTPEDAQAIAAGGEDAVKAFLQSINKVAQGVYANSAFATSKILEHALQQQQDRFQKQLPGLVRDSAVADNLRTQNELFSHPAVSPIVDNVRKSLADKYPTATAHEIGKLTADFFTALGGSMAPQSDSNTTNPNKKSEQDWLEFLN